MKRLRTRNHKVVLNRSVGGDVGITVVLDHIRSFHVPADVLHHHSGAQTSERAVLLPAEILCCKPDPAQTSQTLFNLMGDSWVPFSRYIFNTVLISVGGTFGNLVSSRLSAHTPLLKSTSRSNKCFFCAHPESPLCSTATVTGTRKLHHALHDSAGSIHISPSSYRHGRVHSRSLPHEAVHGIQHLHRSS